MAISLKVSDVMKGITPNPEYEGFATNDDYILAIKTEESQASENDYIVLQTGVTGHEASLNPVTTDSQYIRTGLVTTKTGTQRTLTISGERYEGDAFQDFCMSHAIKFGHGSAVVVPYIYFCMLTGKGEKGNAALIVSDDQTGEAGSNAGFSAELRSTSTPSEYTYQAPSE